MNNGGETRAKFLMILCSWYIYPQTDYFSIILNNKRDLDISITFILYFSFKNGD